MLEYSNIVRAGVGEERSYHYRLSYLRVAALSSKLRVGVSLEAFAGSVGVAGKVDAVVPVSSHSERQTVRAYVINYAVERYLEVVEHRLSL